MNASPAKAIVGRFDRRRILMLTSSATAVVLLTLTALELSGLVRVWHVLALDGRALQGRHQEGADQALATRWPRSRSSSSC